VIWTDVFQTIVLMGGVLLVIGFAAWYVPGGIPGVWRIAAENGTELVDLYTLTQGKRDLFGPDGLHPNAAGAKVIAEAVFRTLCNHPGKESDEQEMR